MAYIETPILYESAGLCYYEPVDLNIVRRNDKPHTFTEATSSYSNSDEVVFVPEPVECRCVQWLREVKGYNVKGDANTIQPNVDKPFQHGVVIQDYDGVRHVSGIKYVLLDRLLVEESNFEKCTPTERVIMLDDPNIVGYYYKNPN